MHQKPLRQRFYIYTQMKCLQYYKLQFKKLRRIHTTLRDLVFIFFESSYIIFLIGILRCNSCNNSISERTTRQLRFWNLVHLASSTQAKMNNFLLAGINKLLTKSPFLSYSRQQLTAIWSTRFALL